QLFDTAHDLERQQHRLKLDSVETALDKGQFRLYYQPKVNMKTGEVFGVEALVRWIHPERGVVPPIEFLPMLESTPMEITLGNWVIGEAMQQLDRWRKTGINLQVSVNISPAHLQEKNFFASLDSVLSLYPEVPSSKFEIEVLESSVVEDLAITGEVLSACRDALGVNVALDDFGTGYSSLTHLRHLPANTVKIDQSFVRDMLDDPDDYSIIEGVVGLAHAFRRQVIAEGVESADHGRMLLAMGCTLAQGYAIARPMPAEEIPAWLQAYRPDPAWVALASQTLTVPDAVLLLTDLALSQWCKRLLDALDTPSGQSPHWPIMRCESSHCGRLLERAKKEELFTKAQVQSLDESVRALHVTGNQLMRAYLDQTSDHLAQGRKTLTDQLQGIRSMLQDLTSASER
ncbi:partial Cyclic di-GMP phosphodiesterase PdeR, partial [Gammaproteobacteria bacterium]